MVLNFITVYPFYHCRATKNEKKILLVHLMLKLIGLDEMYIVHGTKSSHWKRKMISLSNQNDLVNLICPIQADLLIKSNIDIYRHKNKKTKQWLPRSSVEVDISFLLAEILLISIDFPLPEAFRSLDCSTFFSV